MTVNVDPVTITISAFAFAWIFRVDRKITKIETMLNDCMFCRKSLRAINNDPDKKG